MGEVDVQVGRTGDGAGRRAGVHRPQPARCRQRLHRDRRFGQRHDARHDRRHAAHRPDPRPAQSVGSRSTIPAASRCARRRNLRRRTVNVAAQYADWVTKGDVESVDDIPKDSGAVDPARRQQGRRLSRRDRRAARAIGGLPAPRLHRGVEPGGEDMGLPVPWSRFDKFGEVMNGPANSRSRSHLT